MPIYEYHCDACDQRMEKIQKFSDPPLKTCTACGEDALRKLVSAVSFKLKGTGWYETDFKDKPKAAESDKSKSTDDKSSKKDGATTSSTDTSTSTKSDAKSDTKSVSKSD